ncbi:MAG: PadR family transcriptional regulator [Gammaproteobacteria bacterium]|nr:PadR family transcriptional regulator [Gammaproteobacteria bacterium]
MALRYAIIIALEDKQATGYEITKWFDNGLGYFWHASHQQIYLELKKMTEEGLVTFVEIEQEGKPAKKIYQTTASGFAALDQWLQLPVKPMPVKDTLLMKIFAGSRMEPAILLAEVERHRTQNRQLLAEFHEIERCFQPVAEKPVKYQYAYLTLRNGITYLEGWLKWSDEVVSFLQLQEQSR